MKIPIFLFCGLLEAGKTAFITQLLGKDAFKDGKNTLVIACEEGVEEYDIAALEKDHITVVMVENEEELTEDFVEGLNKKYHPQRVVIEYNGMWQQETLFNLELPKDWFIYQILAIVNAETFALYMNNMGAIMLEHFRYADLVVINRASQETNLSAIRGTVKSVNTRGRLFTASSNFEMEPVKEELPYDLDQDLIEITDENYGIWYIDLWDHPQQYANKCFKVNGLFFKQPTDPKDCFSFGRFAMPCCADDITLMGLYCHNIGKPKCKDKDSIQVVAEVRYAKEAVYQGELGPVLYVKSIEPAAKSQMDFVVFN